MIVLASSWSLLMCYTIHLKTQPWFDVRTFIQVEGSGLLPGDTVAALFSCQEVEKDRVSDVVCTVREGERVPGVNVVFGLMWNILFGENVVFLEHSECKSRSS